MGRTGWWGRARTARLMALFALVASVALAAPAQSAAKCKVLLKVSGLPNSKPGAGGAGVTVGDRVTMVATATGCPTDVELVVLRVKIDNLGHRVGPATHSACAKNPCRIHDRRKAAGGYDYQVVVRVRGKVLARSNVAKIVWAPSGGGSGGGTGGGTGGGGASGGESPSAPATFTLDASGGCPVARRSL